MSVEVVVLLTLFRGAGSAGRVVVSRWSRGVRTYPVAAILTVDLTGSRLSGVPPAAGLSRGPRPLPATGLTGGQTRIADLFGR